MERYAARTARFGTRISAAPRLLTRQEPLTDTAPPCTLRPFKALVDRDARPGGHQECQRHIHDARRLHEGVQVVDHQEVQHVEGETRFTEQHQQVQWPVSYILIHVRVSIMLRR